MSAWFRDRLWPVLKYTLGPAVRGTERALGWWPVVVAFVAVAAPVASWALGRPTAWLVVAGLVLVLALLLRAAVHFYGEAHPPFPRHHLVTRNPFHADLPSAFVDDELSRVVVIWIQYTNREPRRVSLDFDLVWEHKRLELPHVALSRFRVRKPSALLESPLAVDPETTIDGQFAFDGFDAAFDFEDPISASIKPGYTVWLQVTDRVTGGTMTHPIEDSRPRS